MLLSKSTFGAVVSHSSDRIPSHSVSPVPYLFSWNSLLHICLHKWGLLSISFPGARRASRRAWQGHTFPEKELPTREDYWKTCDLHDTYAPLVVILLCSVASLSLQFTFAKLWLLYAQFEIREKNIKAARQALVSREPFRFTLHSVLSYFSHKEYDAMRIVSVFSFHWPHSILDTQILLQSETVPIIL